MIQTVEIFLKRVFSFEPTRFETNLNFVYCFLFLLIFVSSLSIKGLRLIKGTTVFQLFPYQLGL